MTWEAPDAGESRRSIVRQSTAGVVILLSWRDLLAIDGIVAIMLDDSVAAKARDSTWEQFMTDTVSTRASTYRSTMP